VLWASLVALSVGVALYFFVHFRGKRIDHLEMVGLVGVAEETFSREGKVFVRGEIWRATTPRGIIQKGAQVRVQSIEPGLLLVVESVKD
jgi:membrane-bound ClpP family serine protease